MIEKVRLTTTITKLREHQPCSDGWATLLKSLPADYPDTKPINLLHILKSNGVQDMMWALRAATPDLPKLRVAICADMAARVLKYYEARYPDDKRPRDCIKACRQFVRGKITLTLGKAAATATAASADATATAYAASAAAAYAAYAAGNAAYAAGNAAYAASADATAYAAYAASADATAAGNAYDDTAAATERKAQARIIRKYLE